MELKTKTNCQALVMANEQVAKDIWKMKLQPLDEEFDLLECNPGQFICLEPLDPSSVMARPFSISNISTSGILSILYKVVGKNTQLMTELKPEQEIKIWLALGNGYEIHLLNYHLSQKMKLQ